MKLWLRIGTILVSCLSAKVFAGGAVVQATMNQTRDFLAGISACDPVSTLAAGLFREAGVTFYRGPVRSRLDGDIHLIDTSPFLLPPNQFGKVKIDDDAESGEPVYMDFGAPTHLHIWSTYIAHLPHKIEFPDGSTVDAMLVSISFGGSATAPREIVKMQFQLTPSTAGHDLLALARKVDAPFVIRQDPSAPQYAMLGHMEDYFIGRHEIACSRELSSRVLPP